MDAAKGLLDHVDGIGFASGYRFAVLVGSRGNHPARRVELVGGISERLVLARIQAKGDGVIPGNLFFA
jgi:hypothetical protein